MTGSGRTKRVSQAKIDRAREALQALLDCEDVAGYLFPSQRADVKRIVNDLYRAEKQSLDLLPNRHARR